MLQRKWNWVGLALVIVGIILVAIGSRGLTVQDALDLIMFFN